MSDGLEEEGAVTDLLGHTGAGAGQWQHLVLLSHPVTSIPSLGTSALLSETDLVLPVGSLLPIPHPGPPSCTL